MFWSCAPARVLVVSTVLLVACSGCRPAPDNAASTNKSGAAAAKKKVATQSDLPRFTYPMNTPASALVQADAATFTPFVSQVRTDVESVLREYEIGDKATLRELLAAKADAQQLTGDAKGALETLAAIRNLEDKPAAKLLSGMISRAELEAAETAHATDGPAFQQAFAGSLTGAVNGLPWDVVQDPIKSQWAQMKVASRSAVVALVQSELDPAVSTSHSLTNEQAWQMLDLRRTWQFDVPLSDAIAEALGRYVKAHNVVKPDIWEAREVTLTARDHLTPVPVAIWDSGVDVSIFGNNVFSDTQPTASGSHGLAFADDGAPSKAWLYPLTPDQQREYPTFRRELQGRLDLENGIDSPEADALQKKMKTYTPEQLHERRELGKWIGFFVHGTHVAGITVRGNPAAKLVVARFNDQLPDLPFQPTPEWTQRLAADFQQMADYFRTRHVRVVNMSWGDFPQEFEIWLAKTGGPTDPAARKQRAAELYKIWHDAVEQAIKSAPDTLFVCAAGNSDSDASFTEDVPAGLHLPNLIAVGAVNQAGDETSFTSYGPTVIVDANGYEVESYVPGGARMKLSGTSMASPNVANLAAKLFALDPSLTPQQAVALIKDGASASDDGRRHLIDPKRSVERLQQEKRATK